MKTIAAIRKNVAENRTYYAFCAGSIATSTTFILLNRKVNLLRVTKDNAELLKKGTAIVYELKGQTVHLVNIEALEAATAAL